MMRLIMILSLIVISARAYGADDSALHGLWLASEKQDIVVKIENCDETLCGRIVWLNQKKSQKSPEICGQKVIWGFQKSDLPGHWDNGTIYRANKNETYKGEIKMIDPDHLNLRGYIGIPLFGETHKFVKVDEKDYPACEILPATATAPESQDN
jgi:uncharacterized protein (DUF2147 family)